MKFLAETYFENRCAVTHKEFGKGFTIHHLEEKPGDILARDYVKLYRAKGQGPYRYRVHYLRALKNQFATDSTLTDRTILITTMIHMKLDHPRNGICKLKMDTRQRLCEYALKTITPRGRRNKK